MFDLRSRLGMSVDELDGERVLFGDAIAYLNVLRVDPSTHLFAAVAGWSWPMTRGEMVAQMLTVAFINTHRRERAPLFTMPWPWDGKPVVSPERRAELESQLKRRSAFRD